MNATNGTDNRKDSSKWNPHEGAFLQYMAEYDKHYDSFEDFQTHLKVFSEVTNEIARNNVMNNDFKMGLNEYSDWTDDEWKRIRNVQDPDQRDDYEEPEHAPIEVDPTTSDELLPINWVERGAVTPIKN